ncbi:ATP-binding protein [Paracoccus tegillarcae]|nr:ATP-binding protein [Paracoccus tegillarcae]
MFHRVLHARPMVVRDTLAAIRRRFAAEIDEDALGRLELVLAEVMNNVTEHGPRGDTTAPDAPVIHLSIVRHEGGLSCSITDDGVSLPDSCLLPRPIPDTAALDLPEGGFGWFLIQDLTQELYYYREETRNFLAFHLPVTDDPES